jgi:hypothetical protein
MKILFQIACSNTIKENTLIDLCLLTHQQTVDGFKVFLHSPKFHFLISMFYIYVVVILKKNVSLIHY